MWVVTYNTESGDQGVAGVWKKKPYEDDVEQLFRDKFPDEFTEENDGPGDWGSYIFTELHGPFKVK